MLHDIWAKKCERIFFIACIFVPVILNFEAHSAFSKMKEIYGTDDQLQLGMAEDCESIYTTKVKNTLPN